MTEEELNKIEATVRERAALGDIDPEPSLSLIALARVGLRCGQERSYVIGWNDGFDHALTETVNMQFPTMLRKMWSGHEVDKWLSQRKAEARSALPKPGGE